jgi:hypothetical protein
MLLGLAWLAASPVPAGAETGRYTMTPTKDGVVRLDTETGEVSLCEAVSGQWACHPIEDNSSQMKQRIEQLERENAELKSQLASKGGSGDQGGAEALPQPDGKLDIPSEKDVDKAMDFVERMLKRFKGIMEDLRKQEKKEDGVPL